MQRIRVQQFSNYQLAPFNTLALPAIAKQLVLFEDIAQLNELQQLAITTPQRWVLGGGSNIVLAMDIQALVIKMQNKGVRLLDQRDGYVQVEAQAGENWHQFVQYCLDQGWYGLENLALIPGTVGAAPVQNIGAYGVELEQFVTQVQVWDFDEAQLRVFSVKDSGFSYRDSFFKRSRPGRFMIVAVQFKLPTAQRWQAVLRYPDLAQHPTLQHQPSAQDIFNAVVQVRQLKLPDPDVLANAGSFFKNPIVSNAQYQGLKQSYPDLVAYVYTPQSYKLAAGWLIEKAGWKGKTIGPVGMHKNQALVLVNHGGATTADVERVVSQVKADVAHCFDVVLEQEPVRIDL